MENSKHDISLFSKYGLEDLSVYLSSISFYSDLLRYYDSVLCLTQKLEGKDSKGAYSMSEEVEKKYIYWTGTLFRYLHGKGTKNTEYEHSHEGLAILNKYLSLRTFMIGHSLSPLDIITISIIRNNQSVWKQIEDLKFKGVENIIRLIDWIEGTIEITWMQIYGREMKKKNAGKKSQPPPELTGTKEIVEAVKRNNIEKAKEILAANPLLVHSIHVKNNKGALVHIA